MRKILALFGAAIFSCGVASAFDLVTPVGKYNKTFHNSVYFMGSLDKGESLYYQTEKIKTAENGAFAFTVPLKQGRNQVLLRVTKDGHSTIKQYFITKELRQAPSTTAVVTEEFPRVVYRTISQGAPLRSTPIDAGINRMSHLAKDTNLIIDGRQGDFYRVYLSPTRYAWIKVSDVSVAYDNLGEPVKPTLATFYNVDDKTVKDLSMYRVAFSQNLPYEIVDTPEELLITIYNIANMNNESLILRVSKNEWVKYSTSFVNGDFTLIMKNIVKKSNSPLSGITIVVDAGHGGSENGALGLFRDYEKNINLSVAKLLKQELEKNGATVYMTRISDADVELQDRVKIAKAYDADMFLSIHLNSVPQGTDPNARKGSGVYYYNNSAKNLADSVRKSLVAGLDTNDDGLHQASFAVLRTGEYLGILAELCYMVNPDDSVIYKSSDFAKKSAEAISEGVVEYVKGITQTSVKLDTNENLSQNTKKPKKDRVKKVKLEKAPKESKETANKSESDKSWFKKRVKPVSEESQKPFLDTSVRQKYEQEAIYVIDKEDTKWYRPRGKKKRVKRPPRVIKQDYVAPTEINIFASGDYEEYAPPELSLRQRTRNFFSKFSSYFYNGARN